ncbi:MAG: hypothetical protein QXY54_03645 [Nitrososphaerota archaeon]
MAKRASSEAQESVHVEDIVLLLLKERVEQDLVPTIVPGSGVYYVVAGFHIPAERLLRGSQKGFFEVKRHLSFPSCGTCRSTSLILEILCPSCKTSDLTRIDLVVHYECGYMGSVEEFSTKSYGVVERCPKCGKTLKRVGIDYGRPGVGFRCQNCREIFQYPLVNVRCDGNHQTTLDKVNLERYPVLSLSRESWRVSRFVDMLQIIENELRKSLDLDVSILEMVRGRSGVPHLIHMLIRTSDKDVAVMVLDEQTEITEAMNVVSKNIDLGIHFIVLMDERKAAELSRLLNPQYFTVIPVNFQNVDEIRYKLVESVYSIVAARGV